MNKKHILLALLVFVLFIWWNIFGCCQCFRKVKISRAVNKLPLASVIAMHTRAHTIDYNKFNVKPADRDYFRACIGHRYKNSVQMPVNVTIQIQEKKSQNQEQEEKKKKRSASLSIQTNSIPRADSPVAEGVTGGLGSRADQFMERNDPIRIHPHVRSMSH